MGRHPKTRPLRHARRPRPEIAWPELVQKERNLKLCRKLRRKLGRTCTGNPQFRQFPTKFPTKAAKSGALGQVLHFRKISPPPIFEARNKPQSRDEHRASHNESL